MQACASATGELRQAARRNNERVKAEIAGKIYDTDTATKLAGKATPSSQQDFLQTPEGNFFLWVHQVYVDGKKLGPHDLWVDLRSTPAGRSRLAAWQRD